MRKVFSRYRANHPHNPQHQIPQYLRKIMNTAVYIPKCGWHSIRCFCCGHHHLYEAVVPEILHLFFGRCGKWRLSLIFAHKFDCDSNHHDCEQQNPTDSNSSSGPDLELIPTYVLKHHRDPSVFDTRTKSLPDAVPRPTPTQCCPPPSLLCRWHWAASAHDPTARAMQDRVHRRARRRKQDRRPSQQPTNCRWRGRECQRPKRCGGCSRSACCALAPECAVRLQPSRPMKRFARLPSAAMSISRLGRS